MAYMARSVRRSTQAAKTAPPAHSGSRPVYLAKAAPAVMFDWSRISVHPPSGALQRKLTVGAADCSAEREADRIAAEVVGDPYRSLAGSRPAYADMGGANTAPPIVQDVLRSPGEPLSPSLRSFMEPRFGFDFGRVRLHRGQEASISARAVNAQAYTVGEHVVLGADADAADTPAARQLLAHELVHVVQQSRAAAPETRRSPGRTASQPIVHRASQPLIMRLSNLSGQQATSKAGTLTSDLTSPVVVGRFVKLQFDLAPDAPRSGADSIFYAFGPYPFYIWRVFDRNTNVKIQEDFSGSNTKEIAYPKAGHYRVECIFMDTKAGATPAVTMDQDAVPEDPALASGLASDSDYSDAERELVDDFRSYVNDAATATGQFGITPLFLASVLREEIANTDPWPILTANKAFRQKKIAKVEAAIGERAAGKESSVKDIDRSVGVGEIRLSSAAMAQGTIPWTEADPADKAAARAKISSDFGKLLPSTMLDLLTALKWPKSNIQTAATLLAKLKNRPNRYPSMDRAGFGATQRACEIIATEYNVGATNTPESGAQSSDYGQKIWRDMSASVLPKYFPNT